MSSSQRTEQLLYDFNIKKLLIDTFQGENLWRTVEIIQEEFLQNYQLNSNEDELLKPIILRFQLDYKELAKKSAELSALLITKPYYFINILEECAFAAIQIFLNNNLQHVDFKLTNDQIHLIVRVLNIPNERPHTNIFKNNPIICKTLSMLSCILTAFGEPKQYIRQSIWYCPQKHCNETQITKKILKDELSTIDLRLGHEYSIIGIFNPFEQLYVAWNIMKKIQK